MPSQTDIINHALSYIGEKTVEDIDENSTQARLAKALYVQARDTVLEEHNWKFAVRRETLALSATPPVWKWTNAFDIPGDCLRIIETEEERDEAWDLEDRKVVTDASGINIRYVRRVTVEGEFTTLFADALSMRLAERFAMPLTGKKALLELATVAYDAAIKKARSLNSFESSIQTLENNALTDVR